MILDEPTRGLDIFSIRTLRELLRSWRAAGRCILMSSHVMADVAELSDKVIIIHQGRMVMSGSPAEIVAKTGGGNLEEAFVLLAGRASVRTMS
jgi:sodium transport system ATP-binding protein